MKYFPINTLHRERPIACRVLLQLIVVCLFGFSLLNNGSSVIAADGWTSFQNGVSIIKEQTNKPNIQWKQSLKPIWRITTKGYGQSSPLVWKNHVYISFVLGDNKEQCGLAAYDITDGKLLWEVLEPNPSPRESNVYVSKAAPSPVLDENGIVVLFEEGLLFSCDHSGKKRWQRNLNEEYGAIETNHGIASSLEQDDKHIYVWIEAKTNPYVLKIDKQTGGNKWKAEGLGTTTWASPRLVPVGDQTHLVLSGIGKLAGLDIENGDRLWEFDKISGNSTPTPMPLGNGRFLMGATTGSGNNGTTKASDSNGVIEISPIESGYTVKYVWQCKRATSSFGSPVAHANVAYFVNRTGILFAHDLTSGKELYSQRLSSSMWATPIVANGVLIFPCKDGTLQIISAGREFKQVAKYAVWETEPPADGKGPSFGGPVLYAAIHSNQSLFVRRGDLLVRYKLK